MRDGIYKTCPVPGPWKRVLQLALREADREQRVTDAALHALASDVKGCSLQALVQKVIVLLKSGQQPLIFSANDTSPIINLPLPTSKIAQDFQEELDYILSRNPQRIKDPVEYALKECLRERLENTQLEIVGHVKKECPDNSRQARETIRSIKNAIKSLIDKEIGNISTGIIDGSIFNGVILQRSTFDLDESLI